MDQHATRLIGTAIWETGAQCGDAMMVMVSKATGISRKSPGCPIFSGSM